MLGIFIVWVLKVLIVGIGIKYLDCFEYELVMLIIMNNINGKSRFVGFLNKVWSMYWKFCDLFWK